jgi:DNA-binding transcriptional regulator YiaG
MSNHPNRGPKGHSSNPAPESIIVARKAYGLSQTAAAALVHTTCRTWQQWEHSDRRMHPAFWELFLMKAALIAPTLEDK